MKIFVTGGTGFIGSHFIERLKSWNAPDAVIYVLVRKETQFNDTRIVPVIGDLHKIEDYTEIIQSCDYIFHLAANVNFFGGNVEDDKINFESTKKIVDIVKSNPQKLKNFVFISTIGAVDRHKDDAFSAPLTTTSVPAPTTQYGKSKLKSEQYIKVSGLPFTIIRPTWVYGKNMRENSHINKFVSLVYSKSPFHRFNFPGRVSMIYVGDLVDSMVGCIDHEKIIGKTYFAGTEAESIGGIFKIIYREIYSEDLKQLPVPRVFQSITKKVHHKIPLTAANLFVDYLFADGEEFMQDFRIHKPIKFRDGVNEVIHTNNSVFKQVAKYKKIGFGFFGALLKHSLYPVSFFKQILPKQGIILDLGCGEGMLTNLLAQTCNGVTMIGIDKDAKRIDQAARVASSNARFICRKIEDIIFSNIDAVIINDVLHHHSTEKQKQLVVKALKCLNDNGLFILKEVDRNDTADRVWTKFWDKKLYPEDTLNFRTPDEWNDMLREYGYRSIEQYRVKHLWPASRTILVYQKV